MPTIFRDFGVQPGWLLEFSRHTPTGAEADGDHAPAAAAAVSGGSTGDPGADGLLYTLAFNPVSVSSARSLAGQQPEAAAHGGISKQRVMAPGGKLARVRDNSGAASDEVSKGCSSSSEDEGLSLVPVSRKCARRCGPQAAVPARALLPGSQGPSHTTAVAAALRLRAMERRAKPSTAMLGRAGRQERRLGAAVVHPRMAAGFAQGQEAGQAGQGRQQQPSRPLCSSWRKEVTLTDVKGTVLTLTTAAMAGVFANAVPPADKHTQTNLDIPVTLLVDGAAGGRCSMPVSPSLHARVPNDACRE
jgi:hypothetical protein